MPTVLIVHGNTEWYGSDRSLVLLATGLGRLGWQVEVVVPSVGRLSEHLTAADVRVHYVSPAPLRGRVFSKLRLVRYALFDLPLAAYRIRRLARRVDLVHVNASILLGAIVGGALARRPVVLHVRESYVGSMRLWRWYARLVRHLVSAVVCISTDILDEARATALADRVTVIHNGLDFGPIDNAPSVGPVVAVGRINEWKGHEVLIEAVAMLRERDVEVPVEIAGDPLPGQGSLLQALRNQAEHAGVADLVSFVGYIDDVDGLMRRTGIFVQPSTKPEPFGLSLVEAMGHGLACVATDAGGPRDIIRHGQTGLLIPPGDAKGLADAIEVLWRDPAVRVRLGAAAAADVRERFSARTLAMRVSELYRMLLGSPGPGR